MLSRSSPDPSPPVPPSPPSIPSTLLDADITGAHLRPHRDLAELARRLEAAERAAEHARQRGRRLQQLAESLAHPLREAEVVRVVAGCAAAAVGAESGALYLVNGEALTLASEVGDGASSPAVVAPGGGGPVAAAVAGGVPFVLDAVRGDAALADAPAAAPATAVVPLLVDGRAIGALRLAYAPGAAPTDDDVAFLLAVGRLGALAIERARADARARIEQARWRSLAEATAAVVWHAEADGSFRRPHPTWQRYTGASVRGTGRWTEMLHPDDRARAVAAWQAALARGALYETKLRLWHAASGRHRWCVARGVPVHDDAGVLREWVGTVTDVDDQEHAESALVVARAEAEAYLAEAEAARARMLQVFEQAPVAISVIAGRELKFELANPHFRALVGGRAVIGRPVPEAIPGLSGEVLDILQRVLRTGEPFAADEFPLRIGIDGEADERFFNLVYHPLLGADGVPTAIVIVATEVTEQVRARLAAESARVEAEAANRAKAQFLSTMSHELRTPLNAITGYVELIELGLRGPVTSAQRHDLGRVRQGAKVLMALVNDILNFARLEAGQVEFNTEPVPLASVLADLEALVTPQMHAKGLALAMPPAADAATLVVHADPERLRQVLLNLLTNAMKFTAPGGRVTLACTPRDALVEIRVVDTGRGIPAEQLERVFEPFVQIDRHRTGESQQGVGLGLSIARDLARRMGGELTAASVVGRGSTFTLTVPCSV